MDKPSLLAIPLGGLGEFGMNMLVLRSGDDMILIDAGMMFPEAELLGVDIVIPDITYLKQNRHMVRAIVLTHAHEDHIGAIPYILADLNVPVYGTQFTLVNGKCKPRPLEDEANVDPRRKDVGLPPLAEYLKDAESVYVGSPKK